MVIKIFLYIIFVGIFPIDAFMSHVFLDRTLKPRICFWLRGKMYDDNEKSDQMKLGFGSIRSERVFDKGRGLELIKKTRKTVHRTVAGRYARLLSAKSLLFEKLRSQGVPTTYDIYVKASTNTTFWFVGKLNHDDSKISARAALRQELPLILEYAKSLRPKELSGPYAINFELEVFTTPGNNEMNVAQNKVNLDKFLLEAEYGNILESKEGIIRATKSNTNCSDDAGFEPEVYQGGEEGFRVTRAMDGTPLKAPFEINQKNPSELEKMKGK